MNHTLCIRAVVLLLALIVGSNQGHGQVAAVSAGSAMDQLGIVPQAAIEPQKQTTPVPLNQAWALIVDGLSSGPYAQPQLGAVLSMLDAASWFGKQHYLSSSKLRFALPKIGYDVEIDFGFVGAGEGIQLLAPLQTIPVKFVSQADAAARAASAPQSLSDVMLILGQNEMNKVMQRSNGLYGTMIKQLQLKPRTVFLLKVLLLVDYSLSSGDAHFFATELAQLAFRLMLTGDILPEIKSSAPVSSLLPTVLVDTINGLSPDILAFADHALVAAHNTTKLRDTDALSGIKTFVYVFDNAQRAREFAQRALPALTQSNASELLDDVIKNDLLLNIVDVETFVDLEPETQTAGTGIHLVGKNVAYGTDMRALIENKWIQADQVATIARPGVATTIELVGATDVKVPGCVAVFCCTDKADFDEVETVSGALQLVATTWQGFVDTLRKEQADTQTASNALLLDDAAQRATLLKFFAAGGAQAFQTKLDKVLAAAGDSHAATDQYASDLEQQLKLQEFGYNKLSKQLATKESLLQEILSGNLNITNDSVIKDLQTGIERAAEEVARITGEIARLKAEIEQIHAASTQQDEYDDYLAINADSALTPLLNGQVAQQKGLATLKSKAVALLGNMKHVVKGLRTVPAQKQVAFKTVEDRLQLRVQVAAMYEHELQDVNKELAMLSMVAPSEANLAREYNLTVYAAYLNAQVTRRKQQNVDVERLMAFRAALKAGDAMTTERMDQYATLENSVGYILDSADPIHICSVMPPELSLPKRFMKALAVPPVTGSPFEPHYNKFIAGVNMLIGRSCLVRENSLIAQHIMRILAPSLVQRVSLPALGAPCISK